MTSSSKENVERLYKQREELEAEMASISQRLNGPNMPGLKGALVDNEGFPIGGGDLDLYSVRADRQRYNSLKNDHLKLTNMIEREVQACSRLLLTTEEQEEEIQIQQQLSLIHI